MRVCCGYVVRQLVSSDNNNPECRRAPLATCPAEAKDSLEGFAQREEPLPEQQRIGLG